jgi:RNA polymerase sigma-70 factor (ECF subfamily)
MTEAVQSFAELLARTRQGEPEAALAIAREYERELRLVARVQLGPALRPYLDSLDLVQSVHRSLLIGIRQDKFDISTPANLIALALTMVRRKVARHWRRHQRQQRLETGKADDANQVDLLASLANSDGDPVRTAQMQDAVEHLWNHLDPTEKNLVSLRMKGHSTAEAARELQLDADVLRVRLSRLRQRLETTGIMADWL